jgi:hypothetical protein
MSPLAIDEHDSVLSWQPVSELAGGDDAADPSAKDEDSFGLAHHGSTLSTGDH